MTPAQNSLYWREWAAVRKAKPTAQRHELHVQALGIDKSMKLLTNADFDAVLGVFRAITRPSDLDAQLRQLSQKRARALWSIRKHPDPYVTEIIRSKHGVSDLDLLTDEQLHRLAMTLTERRDPQHRAAAQKRAAARKTTKSTPSTMSTPSIPAEEPF